MREVEKTGEQKIRRQINMDQQATFGLRKHIALDLGRDEPVSEEEAFEWLNSLSDSMILKWREDLSVGNDVIDRDHKYLIEIMNQVERNLVAMDQVALKADLETLFLYALMHFVKEERIASAVGYPQVQRLHDSHAVLKDKLLLLEHEIEQDWSASSVEHFNVLLRDWLLSHVLNEDMLLKPFLVKYPPGFDAT